MCYHSDYLCNTEYITNEAGKAYQYFWHSPWGESWRADDIQSVSDPNFTGMYGYDSPYRFNGKELDAETGNYYYGARYYDPKISIWLSVDPLQSEAPGWSPYRFSYDNPVNMIDPTGLLEDHWEIDENGNATLIDTEGEEIFVNGQNITEHDFSGQENAFSQINEHYGSQAGISSDAVYPTLQYTKRGQLIDDNIPGDWNILKSPQALQAKSKAMSGEGQGVIGTPWDGGVYDKETYRTKTNLINSMVHEKKHLLQNKSSYSSFEELEAIVYQMRHGSWTGTTAQHKADIKVYGQKNYKKLKPYYETSKNGQAWLEYFRKNIGL